LCRAACDIDYLVFLDDLVVAFLERERERDEREAECTEGKNIYIGRCFLSARIASFALRPYFFNRSSPFVTWMSRRGFPRQNKAGDCCPDIVSDRE
jgi:hypothetical protein